MSENRRSVTLIERLTPCECCGYSPSQRHHLFAFSQWGESTRTVQLCPNCHELYHLLNSVSFSGTFHRAWTVLDILWYRRGLDDPQLQFLFNLSAHAWSQQRALLFTLQRQGIDVSEWNDPFGLPYSDAEVGYKPGELDENGILRDDLVMRFECLNAQTNTLITQWELTPAELEIEQASRQQGQPADVTAL